MRSMRIFGMIVAVLIQPAWSYAQPGRYSSVIQLNDIEMRAGPSWKMAKTGKLKKGDLALLAAVGAGYTVGASLWRWAY